MLCIADWRAPQLRRLALLIPSRLLAIAGVILLGVHTIGARIALPSISFDAPKPETGLSKAFPQQATKPTLLEQGKPVERELAGGVTHSYLINLDAGQILRAVVEQRGIDVVVKMYGPDKKQLAEVDSPNGSQGPEPVSLIADATGTYSLEIQSLDRTAAPGRYLVNILEVRLTTDLDRKLFSAEKAAQEGEALRAQGTAEASRTALKKLEEAVEIFRALGARQNEADASISMGEIYFALGDRPRALDFFNRALILRRDLKDLPGEAVAHNNVGVVYQALGERRKALDYFGKALALHRATGNRSEEAITLNNMGQLHDLLGDKQKALDLYNEALPIRRAVGDRQGEAYTLNNIGILYQSLGENQKGLDYLNQALLLWRATGNRFGEATTLNNFGYAYDGLGEKQTALEYYDQSLALRRTIGDRAGEAASLNNIGLVYDSLEDQEKALDYYNQAIPIFKSIRDPYGETTLLGNVGLIYSTRGEYQKALEYFNRALPIRRTLGDRQGEATLVNNIGLVYAKTGESKKAEDFYEQSLVLSRAVGDRRTEARVLYNFAFLERGRNELDDARARIEAALAIIESIRTQISSQQLRASYFASVQVFYTLYIDILMRLHKQRPSAGHDAQALQASERARARSLLEMLAEAGADIRQGVDPTLLERERLLQRQLNAAAEEQARVLTSQHTAAQADAATKAIEELTREYQNVQTEIRTKSPRYAALTQPRPLDLRSLQTEILDQNTMLLEYSLGESASYLWAVTHDSIASFTLPNQLEIEAVARRVYELMTSARKGFVPASLSGKDSSPEKIQADLAVESARLSQLLLGPVASRLGTKRLLIVADGALQYIPFAALPTPTGLESGVRSPESKKRPANGRRTDSRLETPDSRLPLIVEHEIVTLPSASTLHVLRRETEGRKSASRAVAVFADPVFERDDVRLKRLMSPEASSKNAIPAVGTRQTDRQATEAARDVGMGDAGRRIPRLPGTRFEASQILSLVGPTQRKQALDFAANRAAATSSELGEYRIVHFATHGFLNSVHPELSGIVLSMFDEKGIPQDGFLRAHEVYNLRLSAELVVLSACQTGLGKEVRGEGLVGLTRGFMYAGAPRVVVSLWDVNDEATADLMVRFYRGILKQRQPPAAALRAAQIQMWRQSRWQSPYYWAAFTLQGEWR